MELDHATIQWLSLLQSSPEFVVKVGSDAESATVVCLNLVPKDTGEYWVSGTTVLKNGVEIPSVFRVDTNAGGALIGAYWYIDDEWWNFQDRPGVFEALGYKEAEIFPFDWAYAVNLEDDMFHV